MKKICTIWDDGLITDLKLIEILHNNNATASFALSFGTHKKERTLNDSRDAKYGIKTSTKELKEFAPFEIINHTASHPDLTNLNEELTKKEIRLGKSMLEDFFQKSVHGFCYPYGCSNEYCEEALKETDHQFARTTYGWPREKKETKNPFFLHPDSKWDQPNLIDQISDLSIIWGHTYEITDWSIIQHIYKNTQTLSVQDLLRQRNGLL